MLAKYRVEIPEPHSIMFPICGNDAFSINSQIIIGLVLISLYQFDVSTLQSICHIWEEQFLIGFYLIVYSLLCGYFQLST